MPFVFFICISPELVMVSVHLLQLDIIVELIVVSGFIR